MAGFQFAHMENFSRKGDKGGRTIDLKLTSPIGAIRKLTSFGSWPEGEAGPRQFLAQTGHHVS